MVNNDPTTGPLHDHDYEDMDGDERDDPADDYHLRESEHSYDSHSKQQEELYNDYYHGDQSSASASSTADTAIPQHRQKQQQQQYYEYDYDDDDHMEKPSSPSLSQHPSSTTSPTLFHPSSFLGSQRTNDRTNRNTNNTAILVTLFVIWVIHYLFGSNHSRRRRAFIRHCGQRVVTEGVGTTLLDLLWTILDVANVYRLQGIEVIRVMVGWVMMTILPIVTTLGGILGSLARLPMAILTTSDNNHIGAGGRSTRYRRRRRQRLQQQQQQRQYGYRFGGGFFRRTTEPTVLPPLVHDDDVSNDDIEEADDLQKKGSAMNNNGTNNGQGPDHSSTSVEDEHREDDVGFNNSYTSVIHTEQDPSSSSSSSSVTPPPVVMFHSNTIEPAFLNPADYPPGWLVYHSTLGVVPKEKADAYDEANNNNEEQNVAQGLNDDQELV